MKKFQKFKKKCHYLNGTFCSYWSEETQCHFLSCPFFSSKLSPQHKQILQKKFNESVKFTVEDFDRTETKSVKELIRKVKEEPDSHIKVDKRNVQRALSLKRPVKRMVCVACDEPIVDDKFITIRDSNEVIIYLHSKGKCNARKENIEEIRAKWLKSHIVKVRNESSDK